MLDKRIIELIKSTDNIQFTKNGIDDVICKQSIKKMQLFLTAS